MDIVTWAVSAIKGSPLLQNTSSYKFNQYTHKQYVCGPITKCFENGFQFTTNSPLNINDFLISYIFDNTILCCFIRVHAVILLYKINFLHTFHQRVTFWIIRRVSFFKIIQKHVSTEIKKKMSFIILQFITEIDK